MNIKVDNIFHVPDGGEKCNDGDRVAEVAGRARPVHDADLTKKAIKALYIGKGILEINVQ